MSLYLIASCTPSNRAQKRHGVNILSPVHLERSAPYLEHSLRHVRTASSSLAHRPQQHRLFMRFNIYCPLLCRCLGSDSDIPPPSLIITSACVPSPFWSVTARPFADLRYSLLLSPSRNVYLDGVPRLFFCLLAATNALVSHYLHSYHLHSFR